MQVHPRINHYPCYCLESFVMKRGLEIRTVNAHSLHGNSRSEPLNSDLSYPFHSGCLRPKALPRSHRKARQFLAMANSAGGTTALTFRIFWCLTRARCTSRSCHMERIRHSRFNVDTWFLIVFDSLLFVWIVPSPFLKFSHCHVTFLAMAFA